MLVVPKKLTIDIELFANSGNSALTAIVYSALMNYAKTWNTQTVHFSNAHKIAWEVGFMFNASKSESHRCLYYLDMEGLISKDDDGNYVLIETIK